MLRVGFAAMLLAVWSFPPVSGQTAVAAEGREATVAERVHEVGDLAATSGLSPADLAAFIRGQLYPRFGIESRSAPLSVQGNRLLVRAPADTQALIGDLIIQLRKPQTTYTPKGDPATADRLAKLHEKLGKRASFAFVETPFEQAIAAIEKESGVTIVRDAVRSKATGNVTLRVTDMSCEMALTWVLKSAELSYKFSGDSVVLVRPGQAPDPSEVKVAVYDVRSIAVSTQGTGGRTAIASLPTAERPPVDELISFLGGSRDVSNWNPRVDGGMTELAGYLVVFGHDEVHYRVSPVLELLHVTAGKDGTARLANPERPTDAEWRSILSRRCSLEFQVTPLKEALEFFRLVTGKNVVLDPKAVSRGEAETKINLRTTNLEAGLTLRWILRHTGLAFDPRDCASRDCIFVTSYANLSRPVSVMYNVGDLPIPPRSLAILLHAGMSGRSGYAKVGVFGNRLFLLGSEEIHQEAKSTIAALRQSRPGGRFSCPPPPPEEQWQRDLKAKLERPVDFKLAAVPFAEALAFFRTSYDLTVICDAPLSGDVKVLDAKVSLVATGLTGDKALGQLLNQVGLEHKIEDGAILVCKRQASPDQVVVAIYDVRDLESKRLGTPATLTATVADRVRRAMPEAVDKAKGCDVLELEGFMLVANVRTVQEKVHTMLARFRGGQR